MSSHRASDLLYESEAALRLVDDVLHRLIELPAADADATAEDDTSTDVLLSADAPSTIDVERREGLERALLLLGELDAGHGRAASR